MSLDLFERPGGGERAILVNVDFGQRDPYSLAEFHELAVSAGAVVVTAVEASRTAPDSKFFIGSGKAAEIKALIESADADLVMFNHELSASQERNLEDFLQRRVLDRTGLILDIFAQRAQSFEGKLQVELAQLKHLSTRLVRGWTHLERQKGGIGLRGPGESQLETDRRLIGQRIDLLQKRLQKVSRQRKQSRQSRVRAEVPTVALVGYTNAGKSTLFNRMTGADVFVEDRLFATLDPTVRKLELPGAINVVMADTVGFVRDLPHDLVAAFRSTLLETREADVLLHVVDASDDLRAFRRQQVDKVLEEVEAEQVPQILIFNKIDLTGHTAGAYYEDGRLQHIALSARTGAGIKDLLKVLAEFFAQQYCQGWIHLHPSEARLRAQLFAAGEVLEEQHQADGGCCLHIHIAKIQLLQLGVVPERLLQHDESDGTVLAAVQ
ncbi:MAG: GTPase HflX [Gammaproteobacteria bacterium]|nr:GTPase HflX [Gammaproteobacteria bacterium]